MIKSDSTGIKINGHRGTWSVIDSTTSNSIRCHLLEHETYGDGAASIIVTSDGKIILDEVYNGFSDLYEAYPNGLIV
jgi:hypothetical protein